MFYWSLYVSFQDKYFVCVKYIIFNAAEIIMMLSNINYVVCTKEQCIRERSINAR